MRKKIVQTKISKRRKNVIILLLGTLIAIGPFSIDTYLPAFKQIAGDFNVDTSAIGLTLTTYFIGIGLGQLAYGPLMDKYGRRKPLIVGLTLYILMSILCGLAWDLWSLAFFRFFMALGGCAGMVASKAVVRDYFEKDQVADVLSTLMLIMGVAPIIAPTVGGFIITAFHWEVVFFCLAGFAAIMLFNVVYILPESAEPISSTSLRPTRVAKEYWSIYKNKDFFLFSTTRGFAIGALLAYVASAPFVFIEFFGISEDMFGYIFGGNAAGLILGSQLNRLFLKRFTTFQITFTVAIIMAFLTCGITIYSLLVQPHFWVIYPGLFTMLFFIGFQNPNVTALSLQPFNLQAGSASALVGAVSMIFGSIASTLVAQLLVDGIMPLLLIVTICSIAGCIAVVYYKVEYGHGYAFAKAYYHHPHRIKQRREAA
ncbi:MFS transporter, DHA1 family, bicyclomycin/chloramphenicol resistance protein [Nonlabens sp. Hel1_33_55]|uniref:multidrug effflux MFS transporter n=1 Tax=Nonlabens sp. Hel1_33_55 TaxID=1336802 RepID=UPI000875AEDD|nr:multidrug effflux MFS transporter [Nonlabens sp. Hel1_33_55]SCY25520.1 MFS transporter, DHA1 family, bicyclomycin/chloramphenicol resistance protein [Nonlabens sp. Hel1_33_55]